MAVYFGIFFGGIALALVIAMWPRMKFIGSAMSGAPRIPPSLEYECQIKHED